MAQDAEFTPLMTLYLTDRTKPEEIVKAKESGHVCASLSATILCPGIAFTLQNCLLSCTVVLDAVKLYPAGATTNSDNGVTDIPSIYPTLRQMAKVQANGTQHLQFLLFDAAG